MPAKACSSENPAPCQRVGLESLFYGRGADWGGDFQTERRLGGNLTLGKQGVIVTRCIMLITATFSSYALVLSPPLLLS